MSLPLADQQWIVVAADEVQEQLARSPLELKPKRVEVFTETDAFDEEAWRLRLYLPRPQFRLHQQALLQLESFALRPRL